MSPIPQRDNPNRGDGESDEISSMETPQIMIAAGSSEDEEEFDNYQGYQPLPQEPDAEMEPVPQHEGGSQGATANAAENSVAHVDIDHVLMHTMDSQAFQNAPGGNIFDVQGDAEEDEVNKLWNAPRPQETKQTMSLDEDQAEKIKAAMSGFMIPKASHPNWANFLPEEEWKSQVLQKARTDRKPQKVSVQDDEVYFEVNFDEALPNSSESGQPSSSGT